MTERQIGKGIQLGLIEDKYLGVITQADQGDTLTLLTPSQGLLFAQWLTDKAHELQRMIDDSSSI